ncbi:glycoside hydrolase family 1 protein [Spiroplasma culicicola]|uniref:6-phospho-beta-glucosidase n=1 Tax=Spiroplasma culicicola AES-1 TaxID=1276246 RepID=W6A7J7_9MOLU|nr:glycoside hydrolase family 1 protein [Spiroplasma culicicola]AHI52956.1 6-phospho-beta-glucosidase [Spiroplasma culicicola AES-1]
MSTKFPKEFLWGASSSAYQFEGGYDTDGKGLSVQDLDNQYYPKDITDFKVASDHYNHWKEDVALMAEMGFKSYRFSIAWTRILPDGDGEVNQKGIEFYNNLIDELLKHNIEPIITMYHFDLPAALQEKGGWQSLETVKAFEKFGRVLFENFGSKVKYWLTINELNVIIMAGHIIGVVNNKEEWEKVRWHVFHNLNLAQAKAINLFRKMVPNGKIGPAPNISDVYPASSKPADNSASFNFNVLRNWLFLDIVCKGQYNPFFLKLIKKQGYEFNPSEADMQEIRSAKPDFVALNYYSTLTVEMMEKDEKVGDKVDQQIVMGIPGFGKAVKNPNLEKTQFGWEIDPIGFKNTLKAVYDRYNLPILITENGIGAREQLTAEGKVHDDHRIEYYTKHFKQMAQAIDEGVEMIGYNPWSAIDLVSTHEGISKRYGFVYVNRDEFDLKDMKRYRKDSFYWYQNVIKTNGSEF